MNDDLSQHEALTRLIQNEIGGPSEEAGFLADTILAAGFSNPNLGLWLGGAA